jgi:hypothetical protein
MDVGISLLPIFEKNLSLEVSVFMTRKTLFTYMASQIEILGTYDLIITSNTECFHERETMASYIVTLWEGHQRDLQDITSQVSAHSKNL